MRGAPDFWAKLRAFISVGAIFSTSFLCALGSNQTVNLQDSALFPPLHDPRATASFLIVGGQEIGSFVLQLNRKTKD
jgi:hypothetical protein